MTTARPAKARNEGQWALGHLVSNIAYTKKLWQAIRAQDVCGNDALDSLAQPYVIG